MDGEGRDGIFELKATLRDQLKSRRAALSAEQRSAASRAIAWHALAALPWRERPRVSVFWSFGDELDTRPILHCLFWLGAQPLLPRMRGRDQPLAFHPWEPMLELRRGSLGVMEPTPDLPEAVPEIVLTPLLAFDREGRRLGYGGGYYDRTFASLTAAGHPVLRCGLALAAQEIAAVPEAADDIQLDMIVTENGSLYFSPRRLRS